MSKDRAFSQAALLGFPAFHLFGPFEWVIDRYQVSTDKPSGIANDPNRPDDPEYIVRLLGQIITVTLETVKVVKALPSMETRGASAKS